MTPPTLSLILPLLLDANNILRGLCVYLICVFTLVHTHLSKLRYSTFWYFTVLQKWHYLCNILSSSFLTNIWCSKCIFVTTNSSATTNMTISLECPTSAWLLLLLLLLSRVSRVRLCRPQPTRLRHPWDSPGKNTGVGCHFLLQCMKVKSESEVAPPD